MITEAEILSIDYNTSTCRIHIPFFDTVASIQQTILSATISVLPGIFNGYSKGDLVWVAFENNRYEHPIVIGKIYQTTATEGNINGSTVISSDLKATNSAELPLTTKITNADKKYNSLLNLINKIKTLETEVNHKYQASFTATINNRNEVVFFDTNYYYDNQHGIAQILPKLAASGFTSAENYRHVVSTGNIYGIYVDTTADTLQLKTLPESQINLASFKCIDINQI